MKKFPIVNERLYLSSPSINVCFRTIIKGAFDKRNIEDALKKVCLRHPFLNSFLEMDNDNNRWLVQKDDPINVEYYKANEMDWQTWYKKNDNNPFYFSRGPLVKFCVIIDKNIEIIILGHHIVGDGIGYFNMTKDILLALDNRIDITPLIPPYEATDKYFKKTILLDPGVHSYANSLNEEWRKSRIRFSEKEYLEFFEHYRSKHSPTFYMASIKGNDAKKLLEKSKSNGLTINETIASAFSVAIMKILNKNEIRLGVAANIRNELVSEPNNCMGNYVTGISTKAHYDPSNDFVSNAKTISAMMKEQLLNEKNRHLVVHFLGEFDKDLIESIMFAAYGNFDHPVSKKLAELIGEQTGNKGLGISNLGRHNFNDYHSFKIMDIQFIVPAFPANLLTVGVITVNDKFNLCLRYNKGEIKTNIVKTIYKEAIGLLI
jgi:hypothetical protein